MKKVIYQKYGSIENLEMQEAVKPAPAAGELLIKVKAVSINPLDWKIIRGELKIMSGSGFPKMVGMDFSGIVEGAGSGVTRFSAGDEVFGLLDAFKAGALAEYITVKEAQIGIKPKDVPFPEAAAMVAAGLSAQQILTKSLSIWKGQEILVNGASGGVGMFVIQLAKLKGATITAVAREASFEQLKEWGADTMVDYKKHSVTKMKKQFDAVIDLSTKLSYSDAKAIMKDGATFVTTNSTPLVMISSIFTNLFAGKKYRFLMLKAGTEDMKIWADQVAAGLDIALGKTFSIDKFREGYQEVQNNGVIGKAVIVL